MARLCRCTDLDPYSDQQCDRALGRRYRVVSVVADSERGSAAASGAYTCYAGTPRLPVCEQCYVGWVADLVEADDHDYVSVSDRRAHRVADAAARRCARGVRRDDGGRFTRAEAAAECVVRE